MRNKAITVKILSIQFPNIGTGLEDGFIVKIKGALPGQTVSARVKKRRKKSVDAVLIDVLEKADYEIESNCSHQGDCGGCSFQTLTYKKQLELKEKMVTSLFESENIGLGRYHGIFGSPEVFHYRNKMEFSFGDTGKDGQLSLGMRKKNSRYEVVMVQNCKIIDDDYRSILSTTVDFFKKTGDKFYNTRSHDGVLRHLVVRKSKNLGDIVVNLVTTSEFDSKSVYSYSEALLSLDLSGTLAGVAHTINDGLADAVKLDNMRLIYGREYFYDQVMGLKFKVTPESFFQTNTLGAELLYSKILELVDCCGLAYDLYCGTGTITQIIARRAKRAVGVELIPEAVESAKVNAKLNGVENVEFICGDVLTVVDELNEAPDLIILDPPRDGMHPKAIGKIIDFSAKKIIYISCKATSLTRDLGKFTENGYAVSDSFVVDLFPGCAHMETVVVISRVSV